MFAAPREALQRGPAALVEADSRGTLSANSPPTAAPSPEPRAGHHLPASRPGPTSGARHLPSQNNSSAPLEREGALNLSPPPEVAPGQRENHFRRRRQIQSTLLKPHIGRCRLVGLCLAARLSVRCRLANPSTRRRRRRQRRQRDPPDAAQLILAADCRARRRRRDFAASSALTMRPVPIDGLVRPTTTRHPRPAARSPSPLCRRPSPGSISRANRRRLGGQFECRAPALMRSEWAPAPMAGAGSGARSTRLGPERCRHSRARM